MLKMSNSTSAWHGQKVKEDSSYGNLLSKQRGIQGFLKVFCVQQWMFLQKKQSRRSTLLTPPPPPPPPPTSMVRCSKQNRFMTLPFITDLKSTKNNGFYGSMPGNNLLYLTLLLDLG